MFQSYLKARYRSLFLVSPEDARVELELARALKELGYKVVVWSGTDGFTNDKGESLDDSDEAKMPVLALTAIRKGTIAGAPKDQVVYLMKDLHPFFAPGQDPRVTRLIRDISREFKTVKKTLIMLSPFNTLPKELERDVTLLEFGLPAREMIATMAEKFLKENGKVVGSVEKDESANIIEALLGLTTTEAENALAKGVVDWKAAQKAKEKDDKVVVSNISELVMAEKANAIRKNGVLEWYATKSNMAEIGGLANLKEWLSIRKLAFTEKARAFGLPAPRGLMLVGSPGCGKSLSAKACAANFGVPLIKFDVGRVFAGLVGQSEANMRSAINTAEAVGRCILWVDEIEKAFAGLASSGSTDSGVSARVFGNFITWMQEKTAPVFIIATCNKIDNLPPELLRKGRFDEIFFVDMPSPQERLEILKIHVSKRNRNLKKFDFTDCVNDSEGFSGAELEEAVISGLYKAFYKNQELMDLHILASIRETTPLSRSRAGSLNDMRKWAQDFAQNASTKKDVTASTSSRKVAE